MVMDSVGVDSAPTVPQFADDITQEELTNMVEDYQDNMGIETNPPGGAARAIGTLTKGVGGLGPGSWQSLRLPGVSLVNEAVLSAALLVFSVVSVSTEARSATDTPPRSLRPECGRLHQQHGHAGRWGRTQRIGFP